MLEGRNITYTRSFLLLFSNLSFLLKQGEILAVKGANGAGKSTFLRILAGLIRPLPNTLFWDGVPLSSENLNSYQQSLLYVGHKLCLHPEALVRDQMSIWRDLYGISQKPIEAALEVWGMDSFKNKKISHLSQGQKKRLSLSRCSWLMRPLWILDEPQAGLDQRGKDLLFHTISQHLKKEGEIIIATHEEIASTGEISL